MKKVFIIAEAGVNHNGSMKIAEKLIKVAAKAKADAVKFQSFITEEEISKNAPKADYQVNQNNIESQFDMVKKLELSFIDHKKLKTLCLKNNIEFMSSPFDIKSINLLKKLLIKKIKIPSGEINNLPYLREIGLLNKKVILSTGMSNLLEIKKAINILYKAGTNKNNISLLHCNTEYPTPLNDVNLNAIITMKNEFKIDIGYSDHTINIETPIAAVAMGAVIIEKHFTLDRSMIGPDHKSSLEPDELKSMVLNIRNTEKLLGSFEKKISNSEKKNLYIVRKSIVANRKIKKGELLNKLNLSVKRPASGISPMKWDKIINTIAKKDYYPDENI